MNSLGKTIRHRAEWLIVRVLALTIPRLPRRLCLWLADGFGFIAAIVHRPGRRVALENLQAAFGADLTPGRRKLLVRYSYQHFARAMTDLFWSPCLTSTNVRTMVDLESVERLRSQPESEQGVIFACLHYGGFEWIALVLGLSGFDCTVVTQAFKNPLLNETFKELREVSGQQTIRREGAILRLYKALRKRRSVTLAVDLTVSAKLPSVPITCFGLQTCVTFAHAWLHKRAGAPIIPTHCEPLPDGRYRLVLHPELQLPPSATNQEIAQACWECFEPVILRNPAPWLWMYKHWRYRPANAPERYPYYANESGYFQRLLKRTAREKTNASRAQEEAAL